MILDNWKNIRLSKTEDDIYRESLDTDATIKRVSNWKLGDTPTHWNRFTENVLPANRHNETNRYLRSLSFANEKLTEDKKENYKEMFERLLKDADLTMDGYTGDEKTSVGDTGFFYFNLDESLSVEFDPDTKEWYVQYVYADNWEDVLEYGDVDDVVRLDGNGWDSLIDSLFDNTMAVFGSLNREDYYLSKKESKTNKVSRLREEYEDDCFSDEIYQKICSFFNDRYNWELTKEDIQRCSDYHCSLNYSYRCIPLPSVLGGVHFNSEYHRVYCAIDTSQDPIFIKPAGAADTSFFSILDVLKSLGEKYTHDVIKTFYLDMNNSRAEKVKVTIYLAYPLTKLNITYPDFVEESYYSTIGGDCLKIEVSKSKFLTKSFQKKLTAFLDEYTPLYKESLGALSFVTSVENQYFVVAVNSINNNISIFVNTPYYKDNVVSYLSNTFPKESNSNGVYQFVIKCKGRTVDEIKDIYEELMHILRSRRNTKTIIPNDKRNDFVALWLTKLTKEQVLSCGGLVVWINKYGDSGNFFPSRARDRNDYINGSDWKVNPQPENYNFTDKMVINPYKFLKVPKQQQLSYLKKGLSQIGFDPEKGSYTCSPMSFYSYYKGIIGRCRGAIANVQKNYNVARNYKEKKRIENERFV